ncbi:MAG: MOSC domain-containing protein, partial [Burkholderiales bacterium]|nr:MOSC domain-containing protein [Burkholderiales bacterium]
MATTCMHVTQINIYSIKSTAGTSLPESRITLKGLVWDRQWMLVDTNGQAITGRE